MPKFTKEQWYTALCDVHVMIFPANGVGTIWWNGSRLEIGTAHSNYGKKIWSVSNKNRPTYEEALVLANATY